MTADSSETGVLHAVWTHIIPLAFLAGALGLLATAAVEIATGVDGFFAPPVAAALAVVYLVLGGAYEWSIREEQRMNEWSQKQKQLLNDLDNERDN